MRGDEVNLRDSSRHLGERGDDNLTEKHSEKDWLPAQLLSRGLNVKGYAYLAATFLDLPG
jgi:hypothetical protein